MGEGVYVPEPDGGLTGKPCPLSAAQRPVPLALTGRARRLGSTE